MKKTIFCLLLFGTTGMAYTQTDFEEEVVELSEVLVTATNHSYEIAVIDSDMPPSVRKLEKLVSDYEVTELPSYNTHTSFYDVKFKQANGYILATYRLDVVIIQTEEKFRDITLPPKLSKHIYRENPGWIIYKDAYTLTYSDQRGITRAAKVYLQKNGERRILKIDNHRFKEINQN